MGLWLGLCSPRQLRPLSGLIRIPPFSCQMANAHRSIFAAVDTFMRDKAHATLRTAVTADGKIAWRNFGNK